MSTLDTAAWLRARIKTLRDRIDNREGFAPRAGHLDVHAVLALFEDVLALFEKTLPEPVLVKCPTCVADGATSALEDVGRYTPGVRVRSYYDEGGRHHVHDPNQTRLNLRCTRGHAFTHTLTPTCWCGWQDTVAKRHLGTHGPTDGAT